jgi:hypothetical protein
MICATPEMASSTAIRESRAAKNPITPPPIAHGKVYELVSCDYRYMGVPWCLIRYQGRQGYARGAYLVPVTATER